MDHHEDDLVSALRHSKVTAEGEVTARFLCEKLTHDCPKGTYLDFKREKEEREEAEAQRMIREMEEKAVAGARAREEAERAAQAAGDERGEGEGESGEGGRGEEKAGKTEL